MLAVATNKPAKKRAGSGTPAPLALVRAELLKLGGEWLRRTPEVQAFVNACALVAPGPELA